MPYVSELLHTRITDGNRPLGRVSDVLARPGPAPVVSAVVVDREHRFPWTALSREGRDLRVVPDGAAAPATEEEISLGRGLLDRQILDARGMKVVRVNDVKLDGELRVVGVDVGARGFLRRLGLERIAVWFADILGYSLPETIIPWSYVASLDGDTGLRLGVDRQLLSRLRPIEVAEILEGLGSRDRARLLERIDDRALGDALSEASGGVRLETLDAIGAQRSSQLLTLMPPDEAVDVLGGLPPERAHELLESLEPGTRERLAELLGYHPRSAGGLMTPEFVSVPVKIPVQEAIGLIRAEAPGAESVYYVYAVDAEGCLRGVVPLRDLLTAPASTPVSEVTRPDVVRVNVDDPEDEVVETMERYDLLALPVVDRDDVLRGIITVDDIMRTLRDRASEDLETLTGAGERAPAAFLSAGRFWGLAGSIAGGLVAAVLLLRISEPSDPWFVAGAIPLVLRLAYEQGAWALAGHLERHRAGPEIAGGVVVAVVPAALLGAVAAVATDTRTGALLAVGVALGSAAASALGVLLPSVLGAVRAGYRSGRLVPLVSSLGGLAVYVSVWDGAGR